MESGKSFMNTTKRTGPKRLPCGILLFTGARDDRDQFTLTYCLLFSRKACIQVSYSPWIPCHCNLHSSLLCGTESKAFAKSFRHLVHASNVVKRFSAWAPSYETMLVSGEEAFLHDVVYDLVPHLVLHHLTDDTCKAHSSVISRGILVLLFEHCMYVLSYLWDVTFPYCFVFINYWEWWDKHIWHFLEDSWVNSVRSLRFTWG